MDQSIGTPLLWSCFVIGVAGIVVFDVAVLHRSSRVVPLREAVAWTIVWVVLSLLFCAALGVFAGPTPALEFLSAYFIEKALSVDNLFVFIALFRYFSVPAELQHRVLFWGVLAAIVLRAAFILVGVVLVARFDWLFYVLGALLVVTGVKLLLGQHPGGDIEKNLVVRVIRRLLPITSDYHGGRFFARIDGRLAATPLLLVLAVIEVMDIVFATDSVPAILGVTRDPFLAFTSNILAVLGLRSLFFVLASLMRSIRFLQVGVSLVLVFVGGKMLAARWYQLPVLTSFTLIAGLLGGSVAASALASWYQARARRPAAGPNRARARRSTLPD